MNLEQIESKDIEHTAEPPTPSPLELQQWFGRVRTPVLVGGMAAVVFALFLSGCTLYGFYIYSLYLRLPLDLAALEVQPARTNLIGTIRCLIMTIGLSILAYMLFRYATTLRRHSTGEVLDLTLLAAHQKACWWSGCAIAITSMTLGVLTALLKMLLTSAG